MGYYIFHRPDSTTDVSSNAFNQEAEALRTQLESGSASERQKAVLRLIERREEGVLTQCLASDQPEVVQLAVNGLWECWLDEAGKVSRARMEEGMEAMHLGQLDEASEIFTELMALHPEWAEAANKQATVLYLQGKPKQSLELCREVVRLKPDHFGAWNGMAVCAIQIEDWRTALQAVQASLRLQPRSQANRHLLRLVESRFPEV